MGKGGKGKRVSPHQYIALSQYPVDTPHRCPVNSAFSAFPDTSLFSEGHISYSFKIRAPIEDEQAGPTSETSTESYFGSTDDSRTSPASTPTKHPTLDTTRRDSGFFGPVTEAQTPLEAKKLPSKGETADEYRKWDEKGRKWLYGYVWFQQRKDKSIVRGYMQVRSLLLGTTLNAR